MSMTLRPVSEAPTMPAQRTLLGIAVALAVTMAALYIAAKIHFYTHFDPRDLRSYWAEHWPYTAGLVVLLGAFWVVARLLGARARE
jgi:hypothetical protein